MKFQVKFRLSSHHEDPKHNLVETVEEEREAENLDELFEKLNDEQDWDDECVINFDAHDSLISTNRDFIKIKDSNGKVVCKDEGEG